MVRQLAMDSSSGAGTGMRLGTALPGPHTAFVSALAPNPKAERRVPDRSPAASSSHSSGVWSWRSGPGIGKRREKD